MLVLVKVQPLKEKGDANCARMETDHQNEAGDHGGIRDLDNRLHCPLVSCYGQGKSEPAEKAS